jgi:hypothetical protein
MVDSLFVIIIWFLIIYFCKDTNYFLIHKEKGRDFSLCLFFRTISIYSGTAIGSGSTI